MSLTFPDAYKYAVKSAAVEEIWYAKIYYGAEGANDFLGISEKDIDISSVHYYGIVLNWGEIVEQINLVNSTASTSEFEIECSNKMKTGLLSDILFGTSTYYINRKIDIYSYVNGTSVKIFQGALIAINSNLNNVNLLIESKRPWSKIVIPQKRSTVSQNYEPVAYGNFEENNTTNDPDGHCVNKKMYPMPYSQTILLKMYYMLTKSESGGEGNPHYYDSISDRFFPFNDCATNSISQGGVNVIHIEDHLSYTYSIRPLDVENSSWSNESNIIDTDKDTYSYDSGNRSADNTYAVSIYEIDETVRKIIQIYCLMRASCQIIAIVGASPVTITVQAKDYGALLVQRTSGSGVGTTETSGWGSDSEYDRTSMASMPQVGGTSEMVFWSDVEVGPSTSVEYSNKLYDVYFNITSELDVTNYPDAAINKREQLKHIYSGTNGLDKSYSGGSGTAQNPHEIHRDLLKRFTDFNYADGSMEGWSALNTARTDWLCRWWQLEQRSVEEILEQIQFEGCFIFKIKLDGDGGKYIYIKDSYTGTDVVHTLDENDYDDINLNISDIKDIVAEYTFNYERHPAKSTYLETRTYNNTTARSNWKLGTLENKINRNLDFITSDHVYESGSDTNPNDCVILYYNNILAVPKLIIEANLINMSTYNLEVGDIVKCNDSDIDPYGKTWSDLYFMVTETRRTPGNLKIIGREVYSV